MKVIGQTVLDINESDWASGSGYENESDWAVLDINESDWASGSGYK